MTDHHDSKSLRFIKAPSDIVLQKSLSDQSPEFVPFPKPLSSRSRSVGSSNNIKADRPTNQPTHRPTPLTPLLPSLPSFLAAADANPETLENILFWMKHYHIGTVNYLLRRFTAERLGEAADDFEKAIESGMRIKNPTAFFRSLLK